MSDPTTLSRLQFAFTLTYHYLFPQLTMGLAFLLVLLKTLYLIRREERYNTAARFWARIFAITFVAGVVTGIPMEFQFGTNWARFSAGTGAIIAQTLAMEGAFAFILATNAWMQHPVGYKVLPGGKFELTNYWAVLFNSWILPQYIHTMSGAVITGTFVLAGLGAYYLLAHQHVDYGRIFVTLGVTVGVVATIFQLWPSR